ncbi:MAG: FapA family protein [Bdellovibrionota bacterium]
MGKPSHIKLSYLAAQRRVRCEFSKQDADAEELPPKDLILRAKSKLEKEKSLGNIDFYRIFDLRLNRIWKSLRRSHESSDCRIGVTLGSGAPRLKGLSVEKAKAPRELARISVTSDPKTVESWSPQFMKLVIEKLLVEQGIKGKPNPAQIKRLWLRAMYGAPIQDIPLILIPEPKYAENGGGDGYYLVEENEHRDITLVINDINIVAQPKVWSKLKANIWETIDKRTKDGSGNYQFLYDDLVRQLRSAQRGPERFGMDMPLVVLAAVDSRYYQPFADNHMDIRLHGHGNELVNHQGSLDNEIHANKGNEHNFLINLQKNSSGGHDKTHRNGFELQIKVSDDKMTATVAGFGNPANRGALKLLKIEWFESQFEKLQLFKQAYEPYIDAVLAAINSEQGVLSLVEKPIAAGKEAKAGANAYLKDMCIGGKIRRNKPSESEGSEKDKGAEEDESVNSESGEEEKPIHFVQKGDMIAKVSYHQPPQDGFDIFGHAIAAKQIEKMDIQLSEGIEEREGQEFFALRSGVPDIGEASISLDNSLVYPEDVNLASGRLAFDGDAKIEGSIERGALLDISGNLFVAGGITGGFVVVGASLNVENGINTAPSGFVKVKKNITGKFMENSDFYCGGNLKITTGIGSCRGTVKGDVKAEEISSSTLYVLGDISCTNLGKEGSSGTIIYLGVDKIALSKVETRNKRLEKLKDYTEVIHKQLKVLKRKSDAQKTVKHKEKEKVLEALDKRLAVIVSLANKHLNKSKEELSFDDTRVICVKGVLAAGTIIHIGKKYIRVQENFGEVGVYFKRSNGVSIVPLTELKAHLEKQGDDDRSHLCSA